MDDDQGNQNPPEPEDEQHPAFRTGRIRIIGAEQASSAVSDSADSYAVSSDSDSSSADSDSADSDSSSTGPSRPLHARTDGERNVVAPLASDFAPQAAGATSAGGPEWLVHGDSDQADGERAEPVAEPRDFPLVDLDQPSASDADPAVAGEAARGIFDGPELPHWTEAPTGEVPAVLSRSGKGEDDDDPWASLPTPTWREENADWDVADSGFEPAALGDDGAGLGSLGATADAERQPWAFELTDQPLVSEANDGGGGGADAGPSSTSSTPSTSSTVFDLDDSELDRHSPDDTLVVPFPSSRGSGRMPRSDDAVVVVDDADAGIEILAADNPRITLPESSEAPAAGSSNAPGSGTEGADERDGDYSDDDGGGGRLRLGRRGREMSPTSTGSGIGRITLAGDAEDDDSLDESERRRLTRGGLRGRLRTRPVPMAPTRGEDPVRIGGTSEGGIIPTSPPVSSAPPPARPRPKPAPAPAQASAAGSSASTVRPVPQAPPGGRASLRQRAPSTPSAGAGSSSSAGSTGDSGSAGRNVPVAIVVGVAIFAVLLVLAKLGPIAVLILLIAVVVLAVGEAFAVFRRAGYHPATLLGIVSAISLLIATYNKGISALPLVTVLVVTAAFLWYVLDVEPGADAIRGISSTVFVYGWVIVFGSFGALMLSPDLFPDRRGVAFFMAAVITGVACDVGSYAGGVLFGRHPLAPSVSPGKTVEGLVAGALSAVLAGAIILHFVHPWTTGKGLVLGLVVAVVAPIGDLCESMIKRTLGLKDMSHLLPGHGGILDRVDGLMFVLPATYYLVKAFHLG